MHAPTAHASTGGPEYCAPYLAAYTSWGVNGGVWVQVDGEHYWEKHGVAMYMGPCKNVLTGTDIGGQSRKPDSRTTKCVRGLAVCIPEA